MRLQATLCLMQRRGPGLGAMPHWPTGLGGALSSLQVPPTSVVSRAQATASKVTSGAVAGAQSAQQAAQNLIANGSPIDLNDLSSATGMVPDLVGNAANQAYGQMSGAVQDAWNGATSDQANDQRVAAGAQAATGLLQNGYNPDSSADNQALITCIAGAVSLVPGVGPILGGALMLLDAIGQGIASLLQKAGLIWYGCRTSGNWTAANIIAIEKSQAQAQVAQQTPNVQNWFASPPGSFAALIFPMLAQNAATMSNCQGSYTNPQVLTAAVAMWNQNATGPSMSVYIPALADGSLGEVFAGPQQCWLAFQPCESMQQAQTTPPPAGIIGVAGTNFLSPFSTLNAMSVKTGRVGGVSDAPSVFGPCVVTLSGNYFNPAATKATVTTQASGVTAGQVAIGAAVVGGAAAAGTAIYSFATGQAVSVVVGKAWKGIVGLFK
jgi:hypothetical protein